MRLTPLSFLAKSQLQAYRRKVKITEGLSKLYETLGTLSMYYLKCKCKKSAVNYFPNALLTPLSFLAKSQLDTYRRKVKINRGLVETVRKFGETLNVLF